MGLKRRLGVRSSLVLLLLGSVAAVMYIDDQSLECNNDFDQTMFCTFGRENCTDYRVTLVNDEWGRGCGFKQCDNEQCCCSSQMPYLFGSLDFTATVWKGSTKNESRKINVGRSVKPKPPKITSVRESAGNFKVVWLTNVKELLSKNLTANVTYRVKGSTKEESVKVTQTALNGRNDHELQGQLLEPRTTYMFTVTSCTSWSNKCSDSSNEYEYTTPMSQDTVFKVTIISLCVAAVLISAAIYVCYIKLRSRWQDTVGKCPNPKLFDMHPSEQKFLKLASPSISSVCVEPLSDDRREWFNPPLKDSSDGSYQQSGGISTGSSRLSDANNKERADIISGVQDATRKALSNIIPTSHLTTGLKTDFPQDRSLLCAPHNLCDVQDEDWSCGSPAFLNQTYSIRLPGDPVETTIDTSRVQNKMPCGTVHHPREGATVVSTYQQAAPCPPITLPFSVIPTGVSRQPCDTDSETCTFQHFGISSGSDTTPPCDPVSRVEAACKGFEGGKIDAEAIVCDEKPCSVPAEPHSIAGVDYDYQPFQNLVEPSVFIPKVKGGKKEEHCNLPRDPYIKRHSTELNSELPRPLLSLISADQSMPIITDSTYQCL